MICQGCCQDVNVSHKAVVNRDSLCFAFPDTLRFVDLDMVNKLPQQWGGQLVHLHKLSDGSDKLVLIGRLLLRFRNFLPELWDLRFQGKPLYIVFVGNLQEALVGKKPFRILFEGLLLEPEYGFRAHQCLLQLTLKSFFSSVISRLDLRSRRSVDIGSSSRRNCAIRCSSSFTTCSIASACT